MEPSKLRRKKAGMIILSRTIARERGGIFVRRMALGCLFFLALHSITLFSTVRAEVKETNDEKLANLKIDGKLTELEKEVHTALEKQRQLRAKQTNVKSELDSLGIWMRR